MLKLFNIIILFVIFFINPVFMLSAAAVYPDPVDALERSRNPHIGRPAETPSDSCCCAMIKKVGLRVVKSNNRSLGTLFGAIAGGIIGIILVIKTDSLIFPIFGNTSNIFYQIIGVTLTSGTFANLYSHVGASIDIITGEKPLLI